MRRRGIIWLADGIINTAVLVFFLLLVSYSVYALWDTRQIYTEADASVYETYKPVADDPDAFAALTEMNPEVCGWLTVYGTDIDYPVAQAEDNSKYVNTDAKGEYSLAGCLFLDCQNNRDFSDFNSIIYGHHMEKGTMFGGLDEFAGQDYFDTHRYGNLYYEGADHGLEFFAFLHADAYDQNIYQTSIQEVSACRSYLNYLRQNAKNYREIGVSETDRVVLLSTCAVHGTNERTILAARISEKTFTDSFQEDSIGGSGKTGTYHGRKELPLWWYALVVLLIVMLILLGWLIRRKKVRRRKGRIKKGEKRHDKNQ